jgi:hypothetical protein
MNTQRTFATTALLASIVMVAISGTTSAHAQVFSQDIPENADIMLVELMDGSGSILPGDFLLQQDGLNAGLQAAFDDPDTNLAGKWYVVVIQFSDFATTECTQEVGNQADLDTLKTCISAITQDAGVTIMSSGFDQATTELGLAPVQYNDDADDRQIIDLITDGAPFPEDPQDALDAEDAAIAAGYDRVVAIGVGAADLAFLSTIVDPNPPGPIDPVVLPADDGFVLSATTFDEFEDAIIRKLIGSFTPPEIVGGEFMSIDNSALLIAGLSANMGLIVPIAAGIAGASAIFIRSRMNKD